MQRTGEERREFQRLGLHPPVDGTFGTTPVTIVEIGVLGARVRHEKPIREHHAQLSFTAPGGGVTMKCELVRAVDEHHTGLRFLAAVGESGDHLRAMLADLVVKAFEGRRDAPSGPIHYVDGDKTVRGADAQFLCYRFEGGTWHRRRVFLPEQPSAGFTVARSEDSEEMQRLCRVYAASDDEGRRLIRLFAELSVSEALEIPPRM